MRSPAQAERRAQLIRCAEAVAALATDRDIVPRHVSKLETDHEIRKVLDLIIRRWSRLEVPLFYSEASLDGLGGKRHRDHVVPCRVIVDRMIMHPGDIRELLESAVVLVELSREEHLRLGGIFADHEAIYGEMLASPVADIIDLGFRRYERSGIEIHPYIF
jgi:hypothetical protein